MPHDEARAAIASDLLALGVRPGGVLLMHASLGSLGYVPGGSETVVQGVLSALGEEGTLLVPALSFRDVGADQPVFDVLRTPACIGAIPEHFRTRPGSMRSIHPTHSVAGVGPMAEDLLGEHHLDATPCGPHSPFRKLRDVGGQLLMLGCGLRPNTSMHGVEELAGPPYLFGADVAYRIILPDGSARPYICRRHAFGTYAQRYDRLADLLQGDALRSGPVLAAAAHLVEVRAMWEAGVAAMERNPLYFVEPSS